jgi:hypothetical protein
MSENSLTDKEISAIIQKKEGTWKDLKVNAVKNAQNKFDVKDRCDFEEFFDLNDRPIYIARCKDVGCRLLQLQKVAKFYF